MFISQTINKSWSVLVNTSKTSVGCINSGVRCIQLFFCRSFFFHFLSYFMVYIMPIFFPNHFTFLFAHTLEYEIFSVMRYGLILFHITDTTTIAFLLLDLFDSTFRDVFFSFSFLYLLFFIWLWLPLTFRNLVSFFRKKYYYVFLHTIKLNSYLD